MVKKFTIKILYLTTILTIIISFLIFVDVFNIFHYKKIRITSAEPNRNFVKTKYIIDNPDKFNAFIFGSSKIENIIPDFLPSKDENNTPLNWYNMEYSSGVPAEFAQTIESFLNNNVKIKEIIVGIDNQTISTSIQKHKTQLLRQPFNTYEKNPLKFYWMYIYNTADINMLKKILPEVTENIKAPSKTDYIRKLFYEKGVEIHNLSTALPTKNNKTKFQNLYQFAYTNQETINDIRKIKNICQKHDIKFTLIVLPTYAPIYVNSVKYGQYLKFLNELAYIYPYYSFAGIYKYTNSEKYFFDPSHFRPYVGEKIAKILYGNDEEKEIIKQDVGELFGIKIDENNINRYIKTLKLQIK